MGQLTSESSTDDGVTGRSSEPNLSGVSGFNDAPEGKGNGVYGESLSAKGAGVRGVNSDVGVGVWGQSTTGVGVRGTSHGPADAVYGENDFTFQAAPGGVGGAAFAAVRGRAKDLTGVWGESKGNNGVRGETDERRFSGVYGINTAQLHDDNVFFPWTYTGAGVTGYAYRCTGVSGESKLGTGVSGESKEGTGISGTGKIGGSFSGLNAQIRLEPGPTEGAPLNGIHSAGELYLDKVGDLFLCKQSGEPGVWKQIG